MLVVFLLMVLLIFAPGDLNEPVGQVVDPRNDYSSQQRLLNVGMEVLVSMGGKRGRTSSGWIEDSAYMKNFMTL